MLTIKNKEKILTLFLTKGWMVEEIIEDSEYDSKTHTIKPLYLITIRNMVTKYFEHINLYRNKTIGGQWYELKCIRNGIVYTQCLSKDGIQNIKVLLNHIKIIAID